MQNEIIAKKPVVVPATSEKTYEKKVITCLAYTRIGDSGTLTIAFSHADSEGEVLPGWDEYVTLSDTGKMLEQDSEFAAAWDTIVNTLAQTY